MLIGYLKAYFTSMTDIVNGDFKSKEAKLHIIKEDVAYIQAGNMRYYFHGDTKKKEIELFNGEKVTKTIIPYDGWERSYNNKAN
jgi:hypothetical protein